MASWSASAPSLPSGVSWGNTKTSGTVKSNWYSAAVTAQSARGVGSTYYIKVSIYFSSGSNGYNPGSLYIVAGSLGTSIGSPSNWSTVTRYYTGSSASATSVKVGESPYSTYCPSGSATATVSIPAVLTYSVSYNGNGATGGSTAAQTKTSGTNLTLRSNGFTRTGYHFLRWNTNSAGTGTNYNAGATYTANAAVTLYAQWEIDTYAVSYNGNGADGGTTTGQTKTYGTNLTLRQNGFTRTGYVFVEWNTAADGTGTAYAEEATYSTNAALTLYAIWLRNNIPVYYNDNGTIRQGTDVYYNDNGVIKQATIYFNQNGTIIEVS